MNNNLKLFFVFLKQNDVFYLYMRRLLRKHNLEWLSHQSPTRWIIGAFFWDSSYHWNELHHKWEEYAEKL